MLYAAHTGGLRILARRDALTDQDWYKLIEERQALIAPHLRDMTLKSLGDLKIVRDQQGGHSSARPLRLGAMVEKTYTAPPHRKYREASELKYTEGPFKLDTRGIWPDDEVYYGGHFKKEHIPKPEGQLGSEGLVLRFWGLTRGNQWIKAECTEHHFEQARHAGHDYRPEQRSEVVRFVTAESSPPEICQFCHFKPRWLWEQLGDTANKWLKHRTQQMWDAERLIKIFNDEKTMLDIVAPK
jgi:hypothetical protein